MSISTPTPSPPTPQPRPTPWQRIAPFAFPLAISTWIAIDVYRNSAFPGSPATMLALAAATGVFAFFCLAILFRSLSAAHEARAARDSVRDAHGVPRSIAHRESAGLLQRDLPRAVIEDVRAAGLANFQSHLHWPPIGLLATAIFLVVAVITAYWGANVSFPMVLQVFLPILLAFSSNKAAERMAAAYLKHGHCPSCTYTLANLPESPDHIRHCPECGAAWKISEFVFRSQKPAQQVQSQLLSDEQTVRGQHLPP